MKKFLLPIVCGLIFTAGIAQSQAQVVVRIGPPPQRREVIPVRPREHRDWVWRGGYNRWDGQRYAWVPGDYAAPPHRGARWIPGRWRHTRRGYVWIEGRWR